MLFAVVIAFLVRRYGTQAVPIVIPTSTASITELDVSIFSRENPCDGRHSRTVLDIFWSCLATTFACTWVSVHPNIPFKGEGKWKLLWRRIFLMFFSILAPEFMIMWAFKQWRGAVMIKEAVNKSLMESTPSSSKPLWTTAHGHFLQMGGFRLIATAREMLYYNDAGVLRKRDDAIIPRRFLIGPQQGTEITELIFRQLNKEAARLWPDEISSDASRAGFGASFRQGVLTSDAFQKLLAENLINFPTITEDEINDRSKVDALSKGIALLQLTWFIVQIITCAVQDLAMTELELITAALAGLCSIMYIFWWDKPRDVRFPVLIRTKGVDEILANKPEEVTWRTSGSESGFKFHKYLWTSMTITIKGMFSGRANGDENVELNHTDSEESSAKPGQVESMTNLEVTDNDHPEDLDISHISSTYLHTEVEEVSASPEEIFESDSTTDLWLMHDTNSEHLDNLHVEHTYDHTEVEESSTRPEQLTELQGATELVPIHGANQEHLDKLHVKHTYQTLVGSAKTGMNFLELPFYTLIYIVDLALFIPIAKIAAGGYDSSLSKSVFSGFEVDAQIKTFSMIFYSEDASVKPLLNTSSIAGALFGSIHCLAWHFTFPSIVEKIMWRSASLAVVGSCVATLHTVLCIHFLDDSKDFWGVVRGVLAVLCMVLCALACFIYPFARITLLVLAIISLRSLPPSAFDTVQWVELVPHI